MSQACAVCAVPLPTPALLPSPLHPNPTINILFGSMRKQQWHGSKWHSDMEAPLACDNFSSLDRIAHACLLYPPIQKSSSAAAKQ